MPIADLIVWQYDRLNNIVSVALGFFLEIVPYLALHLQLTVVHFIHHHFPPYGCCGYLLTLTGFKSVEYLSSNMCECDC